MKCFKSEFALLPNSSRSSHKKFHAQNPSGNLCYCESRVSTSHEHIQNKKTTKNTNRIHNLHHFYGDCHRTMSTMETFRPKSSAKMRERKRKLSITFCNGLMYMLERIYGSQVPMLLIQ